MDTISVKIPAELNKKLEHFAALDDRPKSYLVRKAIEEFLLDMEEDEADYKAAMAVLNDPNRGPNISLEDYAREQGLEVRFNR